MNFYNTRKQVIGKFDSSLNVFVKTIRKHKYPPEFQGWTLEIGVVDTLDILDCSEVQIKDNNTKCTYITPFENFIKNGSVVPDKYGDVILVAKKYWVVMQKDAGLSDGK